MPFTIKKIAMRLRNDSEYIPLPGVRGEAGPGVPAGGTTGQVLAKSSNTDYATTWVNAGGSASMTILSYGHSTWADFIAAYNSRSIVYCRASSGSDPASGSQTRLAFMAYTNSAASPSSVEFQYYRSVSSHTDAQQGDQVYIYKLTSAGAWTVTVRDAFTKIVAGTNMSSSYANGTLTLNATGGGGGTSDYDDLTDKPSINNVTLSGNKTAAELGLAAASDIPTVPVQSVNGKTGAVVLSASDVGAGTYSKPSSGIPQTDLASAVQSKLDNTVVVSDTQPTATENKLWVDTDAGAGTSYQIPTVAEMEAADNTILGNLATIESSQATAAHAVGEYIVLNGQLYKVTAAIAAGQTLTVGTNIAAVSGGGLNDLANRNVFLPGDEISIWFSQFSGFVTSSATNIAFTIITPKSMELISTVTLLSLTGGIRGTAGYVDDNYDNTNLLGKGYSITLAKRSNNLIHASLTKSTALTNVDNNTPISVNCNPIQLRFT